MKYISSKAESELKALLIETIDEINDVELGKSIPQKTNETRYSGDSIKFAASQYGISIF